MPETFVDCQSIDTWSMLREHWTTQLRDFIHYRYMSSKYFGICVGSDLFTFNSLRCLATPDSWMIISLTIGYGVFSPCPMRGGPAGALFRGQRATRGPMTEGPFECLLLRST